MRVEMEALAAAASFIAIGQALAAIPKIIEVLQSLVEIRQEILQLLNEVEILNTIGILIRETRQHLPDDDSIPNFRVPQPALLQSVEADLVSIVSQLEQLAEECKQGKDKNGKMRISRLKWLQHKRKIASLSDRAKKNREYLQLILSCNSLYASASNGRMLVDIHTIVTTQSPAKYQPISSFISSEHRVHEIEAHPAETSLIRLSTLKDDSKQLSLESITGDDPLQVQPGSQPTRNYEPLIQMTATLRRVCPKKCACQCHMPISQTRPHPVMQFVYGWLGYAYNSKPQFGVRRCDARTCQRARSPTCLNLRFPLPFLSRAIEANLSLGAITGAGASLHLRVSRYISLDDSVWDEIRLGKVERIRQLMAVGKISSIDGDELESVLDYAVTYGQYRIILTLIEGSASILKGTDTSRRAAVYARENLQYEHLGDEHMYALQKVIELDDGNVEDCWPIHEAVRHYGDLRAVLKESTEGIDALDSFGRAPLHWAVHMNDSTAVQIIISFGANPDIRDVQGNTPLIIAVEMAHIECVQALIGNECDVNNLRSDGYDVLYFALHSLREGSAKMVSILLDHGAQLTIIGGGNALHWLARCPRAAEVEDKFRMLVLAGADLNKKDHFRRTPLMLAYVNNNKVMLSLLLDAGCVFNATPNEQNALIEAACWANAESIDILGTTDFIADIRIRDQAGYTPLDAFEGRMRNERTQLSGDIEPPTNDDVGAFGRLLQGVRDRYLTAEIQNLEIVIRHLEERDYTAAREALKPIIQEKVYWNIPVELRTFHAVDIQIKEGTTEAAIESIEEFIEVSRERIGTDPFDDDYGRSSSLEGEGLVVEVIT